MIVKRTESIINISSISSRNIVSKFFYMEFFAMESGIFPDIKEILFKHKFCSMKNLITQFKGDAIKFF